MDSPAANLKFRWCLDSGFLRQRRSMAVTTKVHQNTADKRQAMNWEAIAAIGETVGALAVVITLCYLAIQVRYARQAAADSNRIARATGVRDMFMAQINNHELRSVLRRTGDTSYLEGIASELGNL